MYYDSRFCCLGQFYLCYSCGCGRVLEVLLVQLGIMSAVVASVYLDWSVYFGYTYHQNQGAFNIYLNQRVYVSLTGFYATFSETVRE